MKANARARVIYGWQVTDCTVTMTHSGYSMGCGEHHTGEHRNLTPLVLMEGAEARPTPSCMNRCIAFHSSPGRHGSDGYCLYWHSCVPFPQTPVLRGSVVPARG